MAVTYISDKDMKFPWIIWLLQDVHIGLFFHVTPPHTIDQERKSYVSKDECK